MVAEYAALYWRWGRKVGRTIYAVVGDRPSDDDVLIGVMDTRDLAKVVVVEHNTALAQDRGVYDAYDAAQEGEARDG